MNALSLKNILIALIVCCTVYLISSYILTLLFAAILAILVFPVYRYFANKTRPMISVFIIISVFVLLIAIPFSFLLIKAGQQLDYYMAHPKHIKTLVKHGYHYIHHLPYLSQLVSPEQIDTKIKSIITYLKNSFDIFAIFTSSTQFFLSFSMKTIICMMFFCVFLLRHNIIYTFFCKILSPSINKPEKYLTIIYDSTQAITASLLVNATLVTIVMTTTYLLLGIPSGFFLGLFSGLLALIPFVLPIFYLLLAALLLVFNYSASAIIVLVVGLVLNFFTDNIIQPKIIEKKSELSFSVSFLAIIAGLETVGILGVFVGPVLMNLILVMMKTYVKEA